MTKLNSSQISSQQVPVERPSTPCFLSSCFSFFIFLIFLSLSSFILPLSLALPYFTLVFFPSFPFCILTSCHSPFPFISFFFLSFSLFPIFPHDHQESRDVIHYMSRTRFTLTRTSTAPQLSDTRPQLLNAFHARILRF